jgi:hypothetical protein
VNRARIARVALEIRVSYNLYCLNCDCDALDAGRVRSPRDRSRRDGSAASGVTAEAREALRRSFLPEAVRVLFVGESPPAGGRFFYAADSALYRAMRDAFAVALPGCGEDEFLRRFAALGCYLDDLCLEPVNQLVEPGDAGVRRRLAARHEGEGRLATTIAMLRPRVIIVLLKAIAANVARAARLARCEELERHVVTYPGRWYRTRLAFRAELVPLLEELARREVFVTRSGEDGALR